MGQQAETVKHLESLQLKLKKAKKKEIDNLTTKPKNKEERVEQRLLEEERFVSKKGSTKPRWLAEMSKTNGNPVRWWNGARWVWNEEKSKWLKDKDSSLPKWYLNKKKEGIN